MIRSITAALALALLAALPPGRPADEADADRQLLADVGLKADDDAALLTYLQRVAPDAVEQARLQDLVRRLGDPSHREREKATRELQFAGPAARPRLIAAASSPDPEIAARAARLLAAFERGPGVSVAVAVARTLAERGVDAAVLAILRCLPELGDADAVLGFTAALQQLDRATPTITAALRDDRPAVRAAAAIVVAARGTPTELNRLRPLLTDPAPTVRWEAARAFLLAGDKAAGPVLAELSGYDSDFGWQAEDWLYRLAGDPPPRLPSGPGRQHLRSYWSEWWRMNAATVDLARATATPPERHLTLVSQMNPGRVIEVNRAGAEVFALENLNGPIDAALLPSGRVVVAEHGGRLLAEYDRSGKQIWSRSLPDSPVTCQRLPNGNLFVVTYSAVLEFRADGTELVKHLADPGSRWYAGQKLLNGRMLVITNEGLIHELDPATGRSLKTLQLNCPGTYGIEKLPGGNYLTASYNENFVREFDGRGKLVWEFAWDKPYHATRLANGNTLIASAGHSKLVEVSAAKQTVWTADVKEKNWHLHRR